MTVRPILRWPDPILSAQAERVDAIDEAVLATWNDMIETMDAMPGYGLAAPQIGVPRALAVVDVTEERGHALRLANPEIVAVSDETSEFEEASPCLPGVSAKVRRPAGVTVAYMDERGTAVRKDFEGLWATSVQHQIDHLAGRLYFDRLSRLKRERLMKRWQKVRRA